MLGFTKKQDTIAKLREIENITSFLKKSENLDENSFIVSQQG